MIPAKTTCPVSWTREYSGYLTSEGEVIIDHYTTALMQIQMSSKTVRLISMGHAHCSTLSSRLAMVLRVLLMKKVEFSPVYSVHKVATTSGHFRTSSP